MEGAGRLGGGPHEGGHARECAAGVVVRDAVLPSHRAPQPRRIFEMQEMVGLQAPEAAGRRNSYVCNCVCVCVLLVLSRVLSFV